MMMENLEIFEVKEAAPSYVAPINNLLAQLSSSGTCFTLERLQEIVDSKASHLFLAKYKGDVVAMLTLGGYIAPTGRKMWIEDVVVDGACRGRGSGAQLVEKSLEIAMNLGAKKVGITSKHSSTAAHRR